MPVKKVGKKWEVNGTMYDTEAAANTAYKASLALKFGITDTQAGAKEEAAEGKGDNAAEDKAEGDKPKAKKSKKKVVKKK